MWRISCLIWAGFLVCLSSAQLQVQWSTTSTSFSYETLEGSLRGRQFTSDSTTGTLQSCSLSLSLAGTNCPAQLPLLVSCAKQDATNASIAGTIQTPSLSASSPLPTSASCSIASLKLSTVGTAVNSFEIAFPFGSAATVINQAPSIGAIASSSSGAVSGGQISVNITGTAIEPQGTWVVALSLLPIHARSSCNATVTASNLAVFSGFLSFSLLIPSNIDSCIVQLQSISRSGVAAALPASAIVLHVVAGVPVISTRQNIVLSHSQGASLEIMGANLPLDATELSNVTLSAVGANCAGSTRCEIITYSTSSIVCVADLTQLAVSASGCALNATVTRLGITGASIDTGYLVSSNSTGISTSYLSINHIAAASALVVILVFAAFMISFYVMMRIDSIKFKKALAEARAARAAKMAANPTMYASPSATRLSSSHPRKSMDGVPGSIKPTSPRKTSTKGAN